MAGLSTRRVGTTPSRARTLVTLRGIRGTEGGPNDQRLLRLVVLSSARKSDHARPLYGGFRCGLRGSGPSSWSGLLPAAGAIRRSAGDPPRIPVRRLRYDPPGSRSRTARGSGSCRPRQRRPLLSRCRQCPLQPGFPPGQRPGLPGVRPSPSTRSAVQCRCHRNRSHPRRGGRTSHSASRPPVGPLWSQPDRRW